MSKAQEACEAFEGEPCEVYTVKDPDWLHLQGELASPGWLGALVYVDSDGQLHDHEFNVERPPLLLLGEGGLVALGDSINLTELGIED